MFVLLKLWAEAKVCSSVIFYFIGFKTYKDAFCFFIKILGFTSNYSMLQISLIIPETKSESIQQNTFISSLSTRVLSDGGVSEVGEGW